MPDRSDAHVSIRLKDVQFLNGGNDTLQNLIASAWAQAPNVSNRALQLPTGRYCIGINGYARHTSSGGFSLAMIATTPGDQASTILLPDTPSVDPEVLSAPDGTDFVDGAIYMHVRDNRVALIARGLRDTMAARYLNQLLTNTLGANPAHAFDLYSTADPAVLAEIRQGVDSIELNNTASASTLRELERDCDGDGVTGALLAAGRILRQVVGTPANTAMPPEDELKAKLVIVKPSGASQAQLQAIGRIGEVVFNDDELPFTIVTSRGTTVTPESVRIQEFRTIAKSGKVLQTLPALRAAEAFGDARF